MLCIQDNFPLFTLMCVFYGDQHIMSGNHFISLGCKKVTDGKIKLSGSIVA